MDGPCGKNIEFSDDLANATLGGMVKAESLEPLGIGYMKTADHLAVGGVDRGTDESQGMRFETVPFRSFQRIKQALADREIYGALLPLPVAVDLLGKGVDIRLLVFVNREGGTLLYSRKAGNGVLKEFAGKSVLVPCLLSVEAMLLHRFFARAGLQVGGHGAEGSAEDSDIRLVQVAPHLMPEIVKQDTDGDIAGFLMPEPYAERALEKGIGGFLLRTGSLWPRHPSSVLVFDCFVLRNHPEAAESFVKAMETAGSRISRTSENDFADFTDAFFGRRLGPENTVTQKRKEMFSPEMFLPEPDTIRMIMDYMSTRMGMADFCGKIDELVQTGWCGEQENRGSKQ